MSTLGVGVVGCGVISEIYLSNAALFPQIELRAVADLNPEAARAKAEAQPTRAIAEQTGLDKVAISRAASALAGLSPDLGPPLYPPGPDP